MSRTPDRPLRRGWTTGACATAATKAALTALWVGEFPELVGITLPRGEQPLFPLAERARGPGWAEAAIVKDAGDDPDVTHGALIRARVEASGPGQGIVFKAGDGVGMVTRPGLPVAVGQPAINPVPRQMMESEVVALAGATGHAPDVTITLSVPGGAEIAQKTWNPRLGIVGGISILGTTGVVRPFSCAAWIASIHRGIDVARAAGLTHVAGATGAQSEAAVRRLYGLPDHALLDMGDFVGGMIKYLVRHPVPHLTVAGGLGKMAKLAQGAVDLHSGRSQVDFAQLAEWAGHPEIAGMKAVLEAYDLAGEPLAMQIARRAQDRLRRRVAGAGIATDVVVTDRAGMVLARAG